MLEVLETLPVTAASAAVVAADIEGLRVYIATLLGMLAGGNKKDTPPFGQASSPWRPPTPWLGAAGAIPE